MNKLPLSNYFCKDLEVTAQRFWRSVKHNLVCIFTFTFFDVNAWNDLIGQIGCSCFTFLFFPHCNWSNQIRCKMHEPSLPYHNFPHHPAHCMVRGDNHRFVFRPFYSTLCVAPCTYCTLCRQGALLYSSVL